MGVKSTRKQVVGEKCAVLLGPGLVKVAPRIIVGLGCFG